MFQFTTTNVINTSEDLTTGKPLFTSHEKGIDSETGKTYGEGSLHVKRVNEFKQSNVTAIYKAEYTESATDRVSMKLSDVTAADGDMFRLSIYIRLSQSSNASTYATDLQYKGKPVSIEFVYKNSWSETLTKLEKNIKKYSLLVYDKDILKVSHSGSNLIIDAVDEYLRLYSVKVEKFNASLYHGAGDYVTVKSLEDLNRVDDKSILPSTEGYFVGREGFGTYQWLLQNLRLPTSARTRAFALNADEAPIPGAKYNEYVIHYCVDRGVLGSNTVGDTVKSATTHVFYVNQDVVPLFEAALAAIVPEGGKIEEVPEKPEVVTP